MFLQTTYTKQSLKKTANFLSSLSSSFSHVSIFKESPEIRDEICNKLLINDIKKKEQGKGKKN